jgi:hypothetical protein
VRFHLLAYPDTGAGNVAIRVTEVRRQGSRTGASLLVSLALTRESGDDAGELKVPVQFEIDGARSELIIEMEGPEFALEGHPVPIEAARKEGWGRISIPADMNPADNEFYFVFSEPPARRTIIVTEDDSVVGALQLAAAISPDSPEKSATELVAPVKAAVLDWEDVALLVWQAPFPEERSARSIRSFVARGGQAIFLPPPEPGSAEFAGMTWGDWREPDEPIAVESWRSDQDLLERTQSGTALPVGDLSVRRYCTLKGDATPLATLFGGDALLTRATSESGGVYFLTTTAAVGDSTLAANGVVMYAIVQRALQAGAESLSKAQQMVAGPPSDAAVSWQKIAGPPEAMSTEYPYHAGAYTAGERMLAVNRSAQEDRAAVLDDDNVEELFQGLDFDRVDDRAGSASSLAREVWRVFLYGMIAFLLIEAALCLPMRPKLAGEIA